VWLEKDVSFGRRFGGSAILYRAECAPVAAKYDEFRYYKERTDTVNAVLKTSESKA
jgi:hypothetical protein